MTDFDYSEAAFSIRADIPAAHRRFWARLAEPGSWWTGAERVAIARESRTAVDCAFCLTRKAALSPYAVQGRHDHAGELPLRAVDAVHRVVTDQSRITRAWVEDNAANGFRRKLT